MCCGVTKGFALEKFSGSLRMSGKNEIVISSKVKVVASINRSFMVWYGWNGILSISEFVPNGLLDPSS